VLAKSVEGLSVLAHFQFFHSEIHLHSDIPISN
jgi:hypothetical protein